MTVAEVHERILQIDDLLVKADTGQISMGWEAYQALAKEAEALMTVWAKTTSQLNGRSFEEMYELRDKQRIMNRMSAIAERHVKLHPEPNPKNDAIIAAAFEGVHDGTKTPKQAINECMSIFAYLVENGPKPLRKGFLSKLLRR
jgi:hypothetical protein